MIGILFVCSGNICRSPMAHAVMQKLVDGAGLSDQFEIESAGSLNYHIGEPTHPGTLRILAAHGITFAHTARQVRRADLTHYSYIIAMGEDHETMLYSLSHGLTAPITIKRLMEYTPELKVVEVPDPYYNGRFEEVYELVIAGCRALLAHIRVEHQI